jgi:hypothetical protein
VSEEQINPQDQTEEHDESVEAHHWKPSPERPSGPDRPSGVESRNDEDDVEAHHWKPAPAESWKPRPS